MDNPGKLATQTQDTGQRHTKQKYNTETIVYQQRYDPSNKHVEVWPQ